MTNDSHSETSELESSPPGSEWILIIGGVLMMVGSFLPWTHASFDLVRLTRDGLQLGANQGFSIDGLITLVTGVIATLTGLSRTKSTMLTHGIALLVCADGLIGTVVGLYDLVAAIDYTTSVKLGLPLVAAGVGYGIWIVIGGGVLITVSGIFSLRTNQASNIFGEEEL